MKIHIVLLSMIIVLTMTASGCYAHGPWRGKVIDVETKEPIVGAAVVAGWDKEKAGPAGRLSDFYHTEETKTDKDGNFEIPSLYATSMPLLREIKGPYFVIYKPGYMSYPGFPANPKDRIPKDFIKGTVIELLKAKTEKDRLDSARSADTYIIMNTPREKIQYFLNLYDKEMDSLIYKKNK